MGVQYRLTPEMSSRKLQVLRALRDYWIAYDAGPSLSELAAMCGVSKQRVQTICKQLAAEGKIHRRPGTRGLSPVDLHDDAVAKLVAVGWARNALGMLVPPGLTKSELTLLAQLDHIADVEPDEGSYGETGAHT